MRKAIITALSIFLTNSEQPSSLYYIRYVTRLFKQSDYLVALHCTAADCIELHMRGRLRALANRKVLLLGARVSLKNIGRGDRDRCPEKYFHRLKSMFLTTNGQKYNAGEEFYFKPPIFKKKNQHNS